MTGCYSTPLLDEGYRNLEGNVTRLPHLVVFVEGKVESGRTVIGGSGLASVFDFGTDVSLPGAVASGVISLLKVAVGMARSTLG